jgi:CO/xanthine dehydrogenase Mo-binding subunit
MSDRMVRKQVYIEPRHERLLKTRAKQLGVTEAELIRRSLEQTLTAPGVVRRDPEAWESFMRSVRRRLRLRVASAPRRWTRDDLYDRPRAAR